MVFFSSPYAGGVISISHRWHRDFPWVQVGVNRGLYEREIHSPDQPGYVDTSSVRDCGGAYGMYKPVFGMILAEKLPVSK